jgi:hypothetical protein
MKKISLLIAVMLVIGVAGSRVMAQSIDRRIPVRTTDPIPFVKQVAAKLPIKPGGGSQKTLTTIRPGGQTGATPSKPGLQATAPPIKSGGRGN